MAGSREDTAPGAGRVFRNAKTNFAPQKVGGALSRRTLAASSGRVTVAESVRGKGEGNLPSFSLFLLYTSEVARLRFPSARYDYSILIATEC